jgi:hypothetical protein
MLAVLLKVGTMIDPQLQCLMRTEYYSQDALHGNHVQKPCIYTPAFQYMSAYIDATLLPTVH